MGDFICIMGNKYSYSLDPKDTKIVPDEKLIDKGMFGSTTFRPGSGKLIWGEGLPDPVIDITRSPGDTDKKGYNLESGLEDYEKENTRLKCTIHVCLFNPIDIH